MIQMRDHLERAWKLPKLIVRLAPGRRCGTCGQMGYVEEKAGVCCACLNRGLIRWAKRQLESSKGIKEVLQWDGCGILDQIVNIKHLEVQPHNASVFLKGQIVQIWESRVDGKTPIKRGEAKILKVYPKGCRIIFEGPLPEGTQRGDFLVVGSMGSWHGSARTL